MSTEVIWLLTGWLTAGPLVWVGFVVYQWWHDRVRRVELDDYTARLRALDRSQTMKPDPVIVETQRPPKRVDSGYQRIGRRIP